MKKPVKLIIFWIGNSLLIYFATLVFPGKYVLGNFRFGILTSAIISGFFWTILVWLFKKGLKRFKANIAKNKGRILFYIAANFVAVWLVARFAPFTGFGVVKFYWALALGFVGAIVQFGLWRLFKART